MKYKTYILRDPITYKVRYVGYTSKTIEERLYVHCHEKPIKIHHRYNWIKNLEKEDLKPIIELVNEFDNREDALNDEMELISFLRELGENLVNGTDGGEGVIGYKHTKETKKKISKKLNGKIPWNKGIHQTDEVKKKLSIALKGRIISEETKKKISNSMKGKKPKNFDSFQEKGWKTNRDKNK